MRQRQGAAAGAEARTIDVLTEIATRFYLGEESQIEIARDLGLDPSTVSRYLKRAREEGIVHVEIRPPRRADVDLGREVAASYGLARVVVAPTDPDLDASLGPVAAEFVDGLLRSGLRIGICWGRTLAAVVRHLRPARGRRTSASPSWQAGSMIRRRASRATSSSAGRPSCSPARAPTTSTPRRSSAPTTPAGSCSPTARSRRRSTPPGGASSPSSGSGRWTSSPPCTWAATSPRDDWARLLAAGAVGNVNTRFFDAMGVPVELLDRRTIAITWDELRAIPTVVAVAAGPSGRSRSAGRSRPAASTSW